MADIFLLLKILDYHSTIDKVSPQGVGALIEIIQCIDSYIVRYQGVSYNIVSLVSDIGCTVFVGFSFFTFWNIVKDLAATVRHNLK